MSRATGFPIRISRRRSRQRLAEYKLDGSVVIAEAIRAASYKLELIETFIVSAEKRRDTSLGTHCPISRRIGHHPAQGQ